MVTLRTLCVLGLATSTYAQGQFGQPENSAVILDALKAIDGTTISSGRAAANYRANSQQLTSRLVLENVLLLGQWSNLTFYAQSSLGFYSDAGAQAIIDYINQRVYPDTKAADQIYINKRPLFVQTGFNNYINTGLLKLRAAVDAAAAAVQVKTPASKLTAMSNAFLKVSQDYANTQEFQQFGSGGNPGNGGNGGNGGSGGSGGNGGNGGNGAYGSGGYGGSKNAGFWGSHGISFSFGFP